MTNATTETVNTSSIVRTADLQTFLATVPGLGEVRLTRWRGGQIEVYRVTRTGLEEYAGQATLGDSEDPAALLWDRVMVRGVE